MNNTANVLVKFTGDTKNLDTAASTATSSLKKFGSFAKGIGAGLTASLGTAVTAASAKLVSLSKQSLQSRADLEQNLGGVETLFKKSADLVVKNAEIAYKTAGVSANEYMQGVTSFAASLLQSTAGNTEKAAEISDMAFKDMSDNANKFGTDMASIQNAYQGFAKQNYTMLDNLKLGYGGTKTEMQRLLADAEKLTGVKYDIKNLSDVYSAIHVIQEDLGVTGTTAQEAEQTISGSMNMAKKSFENFLAGVTPASDVIKSVITAAKNIFKEFQKIIPDLVNGIVELINGLIPEIPNILKQLIPAFADGAVKLVEGLAPVLPTIIDVLLNGLLHVIEAIAQQLPTLLPVIVEAVLGIIPIIIDNIPLLIKVGLELIGGLVLGTLKAIPKLFRVFEKMINSIIGWFGDIPKKLHDIGSNALKKFGDGFKQGLQAILDWVKENWQAILLFIINPFWGAFKYLYDHCEKFRNFVNKFVSAVVNFFKSIPNKIKALPGAILNIFNNIKTKLSGVVDKIKNTFKDLPSYFLNIGKDMLSGLWKGAKSMVNSTVDKFKSVGKSILKGLKGVLGIHSPSTETAWMADMLGLGLTKELDKITPKIQEKMNSTFSVSPTLSNSANTHLSTQVNVINNIDSHIDPLGQVVNKIKTFQSGAKNDYNYGKA